MMLKRSMCALLISSVFLASCAVPAAEVQTPNPTATIDLRPSLNAKVEGIEDKTLQTGFSHWLKAYVDSRVVGIKPNNRKPAAFGPWSARTEHGTTDASDDGSITEWADNYFITHDWSEYGKQVLTMQPNDTVIINDKSIVVEGIFNYPKDSFYEEIMVVAGEGALVIQTCYPDSDFNRIVYGHGANNLL